MLRDTAFAQAAALGAPADLGGTPLAKARDARAAMTYGGMTVATAFPLKDCSGPIGQS